MEERWEELFPFFTSLIKAETVLIYNKLSFGGRKEAEHKVVSPEQV